MGGKMLWLPRKQSARCGFWLQALRQLEEVTLVASLRGEMGGPDALPHSWHRRGWVWGEEVEGMAPQEGCRQVLAAYVQHNDLEKSVE